MSFADVPLGSELQLNTPQGVISGNMFAYDKPSGVLVLKETGAHSGVSNLRILRADNNVTILSVERPATPMDTRLPAIDMERAKKREEKAVQQAEMEASRIGVGVSKEAQVRSRAREGSLCMHVHGAPRHRWPSPGRSFLA